MCGIVGAFKPAGTSSGPEVVARMRDRMAHRGPDGVGLWSSADRACTLGHRRLSIIDLSDAAAQPMVERAPARWRVTFNGEIYNHAGDPPRAGGARQVRVEDRPLRHRGAAARLRGVGRSTACKRFYGMFAVGDLRRARSRPAGAAPDSRPRRHQAAVLHAGPRRGEWLFASEIRALLAHPDVTPEMDRTAFWHYLTFIVTPAPLTMFRGIFKLPAGHIADDRSHAAEARARAVLGLRARSRRPR